MHAVAVRVVLFIVLMAPTLAAQQPDRAEWPAYGRDLGGARFSPLNQVNRTNVAHLAVAWSFRTGEADVSPRRGDGPSVEATPIMVDGTLYLSTPLGKVFALDPVTGRERWRYDARVDPDGGYGDFTNRGVATWLDHTVATNAHCRRRIFLSTIDARLIALDARTGALCRDFGAAGSIDLRKGLRIAPFEPQAYQMTSPPIVVGDLVITGSSVADNNRASSPSGEVRAFHARTGALRWTWDPIPQHQGDAVRSGWGRAADTTGGANAWTILSADVERDLVFIPTTSASPDYFGGARPGDNRHANSIVALRASTGRVVWAFQTVHHDLWDYDNASPPALTTVTRNGQVIPVVLQATKTGQLFVLHRETGVPIFPVEERRVPASTIPGEIAWPTQPFTTTPPLSPHHLLLDEVWGPTPVDRDACRAMIAPLRNEGIFTPPSREGTLVMPSNIGGAHWGGVAVDPGTGVVVVPVNRLAAFVQLIPAEGFNFANVREEASRLGDQYTRMRGTPWIMRRRLLRSPSGMPCSPPPFGELVAVSLTNGAIQWRVPLGSILPLSDATAATHSDASGSPNLGGPIVTSGGLVFIGATMDRMFRAYDVTSGKELWHASLPAGGKATPMTYEANGRQFVVIAAGGGGAFGTGDTIMAFALPDQSR